MATAYVKRILTGPCGACGVTDRNASGGCRPCGKKASAKWARANPEQARKNSRTSRDADRVKITSAAWYLKNQDKVKAQYKEWSLKNPQALRIRKNNRRARIAQVGGTLSRGLVEKLYAIQKGKCACCKLPLGSNYHLDHIMPIKLGGTNTDDNTQLLRQVCNSQKWAHHPVEFMQSRGFLL